MNINTYIRLGPIHTTFIGYVRRLSLDGKKYPNIYYGISIVILFCTLQYSQIQYPDVSVTCKILGKSLVWTPSSPIALKCPPSRPLSHIFSSAAVTRNEPEKFQSLGKEYSTVLVRWGIFTILVVPEMCRILAQAHVLCGVDTLRDRCEKGPGLAKVGVASWKGHGFDVIFWA